MQLFNASKIKSSTWIQYLPGRSDLQGFFATIDLDGYLSDKAVLFSQEGRLAVPSDLIYVPEEFRLSKSQFVPLSFPGRCILSLRYDRCDITVLKRLGVRQLDIRFFFTALRVLADAAWPNVDWHDKLAKMLLEFHTDTLADVPLIPVELCGHIKWIKAKDLEKSPIYFQEGLEDHQVADGTNLLFVPLEASLNHHRRLLLKKLGVGRLAKKAICEAVQQSLQRSSSPILVGTAVSLTKYLFRHREIHPRPEIKYWSAALSVLEAIFGGAHLWKCAHDLYFDDPRESPHTITQFLPALSSRGCLHPDYLQEDPRLNKEDWMDWLIEQGISVFPRPIDEKLSSYKPSEHFISFVKQATDKSLCEVLLRHWKSYEPYLRVIEGSLKERLGRRIVPTKSLRSIALEFRVALPWDRFLDMDDPNNHAGYYDTLKQFGLITELNAHFYLEMLRYHQKQGDAHPKMPRLIHRIYDSLQHCSDVDQTRSVTVTC